MEIVALTWNLFNGRDHPPDPGLSTRRSQLLRRTEQNDTHLQVNRDLLAEFTAVLEAAEWDLALLQECPPRWAASLARSCRAEMHRSLTARNWLAPVRAALARRNPDLLGSWGGGSNLTLLRGPLGEPIVARHELMLRRWPERRKVAFTRTQSGICVANLHASGARQLAEADVRRAAEGAIAWAGAEPLIFGGDLNLRPRQTNLYDELADRFGLAAPTAPDAIDHVLARGFEAAKPPRAWPPEAREVQSEGLAIRLSDHAPVEARFRLVAD